jgi:diguanylate cyclase (GGDEF)-like protein
MSGRWAGMADDRRGPAAVVDAVEAAALVEATRTRAHGGLEGPDRRSGLLTGGSFILVLGAWLLAATPHDASLVAFLACVVAHALASSVEFEIGPGSALPTTPVLVVALFLLPPPLVPVVAAAGLFLAAIVARLRDPGRRERVLVLVGSAWHAMGPAAVFAFYGIAAPDLRDGGVYLLAFAAQLVCDLAASWVRNCYGLGVPTRQLLLALRFTFAADLLLAPIGLMAVLAAPGTPWALLFLAPPALLLAMLQRDRRRHINRTVVLGSAVTEAADQARRDALTGLANRLAWEEAIARRRAATGPTSVLFADVDGLKLANDGFGHDAGDRLLIAVAGILRRTAPADQDVVVARLGGDEFGILLPGDRARDAERLATSLRAGLDEAATVEGRVPVSASIGVGTAASGSGLSEALAAADRGVYVEKQRAGAPRRPNGSSSDAPRSVAPAV